MTQSLIIRATHHLFGLKCLTNAQAKGVAINSLANIRPKIDMILFVESEPQADPSGRKEVFTAKGLILSRDYSANPAKCNQAKPLGQGEAIFHLGCNHVLGEVLACHIAPQFIIGSVNAIPVERGFPPQSRRDRHYRQAPVSGLNSNIC